MEFKLEGSDYIELKNLLKVCDFVSSGSEAKIAIEGGQVKVNDVTETRKANKIRPGMKVSFNGQSVTVTE